MEFIFKSNNIKEGKVVKFNRNSDITKNMKLIEWMKNEILMSVSELFNILFKGVRSADEGLQDILANIIMITYLLAKRLGISFNEIDYKNAFPVLVQQAMSDRTYAGNPYEATKEDLTRILTCII